MDLREVSAGGFVFRIRSGGLAGGRPVMLLHGFPQTSWSWRSQIEALSSRGYHVVAPDQRGYSPGARPASVEHYTIDRLVGDVVAIADALDLETFDVVGHDWGGMVAWVVAGRFPERVRTLTAVSTPHPYAFGGALADPSGDQTRRSSYIEFFRQPEAPEAFFLADGASALRQMFRSTGLAGSDVEEYLQVLRQPGAMTAALNWYRAMDGSGMGGLDAIPEPTMYVWSTGDVALGRAAAEATGGFVAGPYRFEVLEGVSHWVPEEAATTLNQLLLGHLGAH
jgi:pimeloyl-ACP methyl ester carboxylesterase